MPFLQELIDLVRLPNFVAGGPIIISLAALGLFSYAMREMRASEKACHARLDMLVRETSERLSAVLEKESEAKTKLAENLALNTKSIEFFQRILESRL